MFLVQELDGSCVYIFRRFGGKKKTREEAEWREEQNGSPKGMFMGWIGQAQSFLLLDLILG